MQGDKYWVFWRWNYLDGPNTINVTFRGLPNDLTCAFEDPNGTLYFCKGDVTIYFATAVLPVFYLPLILMYCLHAHLGHTYIRYASDLLLRQM